MAHSVDPYPWTVHHAFRYLGRRRGRVDSRLPRAELNSLNLKFDLYVRSMYYSIRGVTIAELASPPKIYSLRVNVSPLII